LLDGKDFLLNNEQVALEGILKPGKNGISAYLFPLNQSNAVFAAIGATTVFSDVSKAIPLITSTANRDTRKFILEKCDNLCLLVVLGSVGTCQHEEKSSEFPCLHVEDSIAGGS
jgi:hypothetical protein